MGYSGRKLAEELCVAVLRDRLTGRAAPLSPMEHLVCVALLHQAYDSDRCGGCRFHDVCRGYVSATARPKLTERQRLLRGGGGLRPACESLFDANCQDADDSAVARGGAQRRAALKPVK